MPEVTKKKVNTLINVKFGNYLIIHNSGNALNFARIDGVEGYIRAVKTKAMILFFVVMNLFKERGIFIILINQENSIYIN